MKGFGGTFTINPMGQPIAPDANELGWKETVRMNPGEVTTVIMKFDLPADPPNVDASRPARGPAAHEYVWHCHILEHEEHDMMRPLVVTLRKRKAEALRSDQRAPPGRSGRGSFFNCPFVAKNAGLYIA